MNILINNPEKIISSEESIFIFKSLMENFSVNKIFLSEKYFFIPKKFKSKIYSKFKSTTCDIIISIKSNDNFQIKSLKDKFTYHFDLTRRYWKKRILANDLKSYELIDPNYNKNIFSKNGPKNTDEIFYFPYGFNFRCTGLGKLDQYGFRNVDKETIYKKEIKICLLGGSSCWGFDLLYSETFGALLQNKLNKIKNKKFKVKIYNYSQHSHVVLDQTITYLLFVQKLNPDIVIIHDGFNDLLFGMITDKNLLSDNLTYNLNHESILEKLYKLNDKNPTEVIKCHNKPDKIIESYIFRKKQLKKLILNNKTKVISALQPCIFSKNTLSEREEEIINDVNSYAELYRNTKFLYEKISKKYNDEFDVNFHHLFGDLTFDSFIDFCHTNEESEKFIANIYFNIIKKKLNFNENN